MADYHARLKAAICTSWNVPEPDPADETAPLNLLLNNLTRIAEAREKTNASPVPFQRLNVPAIKKELRQLLEEVDAYSGPLHQDTILLLWRLGISHAGLFSLMPLEDREAILGPVVDQRKYRQLTTPLHESVREELNAKPDNPRIRGPKANHLAHGVVSILIHVYRDITGSKLLPGERDGLQAAASKIFIILKLNKTIVAKNVIENILETNLAD